jgi:colicin import membrane protein
MKKAAMERYAMKRMRRKFKALQKDIEGGEVDWRTLYNEAKVKGGIGKKAEKAKVDKNKEKRDKEKKKRDKEKETIKKKLKAGKEFKEKKKKESAAADGGASKSKKKSKKVSPDEGETDAALEEKADMPEKAKPSGAPKMKDYEKGKVAPTDGKEPRFKDNEKPDAAAGGKDAPKDPKLKDYEKASAASAAASAAEEGTTKQRKVNKRFKEYEAKDGDEDDGITKKDV